MPVNPAVHDRELNVEVGGDPPVDGQFDREEIATAHIDGCANWAWINGDLQRFNVGTHDGSRVFRKQDSGR